MSEPVPAADEPALPANLADALRLAEEERLRAEFMRAQLAAELRTAFGTMPAERSDWDREDNNQVAESLDPIVELRAMQRDLTAEARRELILNAPGPRVPPPADSQPLTIEAATQRLQQATIQSALAHGLSAEAAMALLGDMDLSDLEDSDRVDSASDSSESDEVAFDDTSESYDGSLENMELARYLSTTPIPADRVGTVMSARQLEGEFGPPTPSEPTLTAEEWLQRHGLLHSRTPVSLAPSDLVQQATETIVNNLGVPAEVMRSRQPDPPAARSIPFGTFLRGRRYNADVHQPRIRICYTYVTDEELLSWTSWPYGFGAVLERGHQYFATLSMHGHSIEIIDLDEEMGVSLRNALRGNASIPPGMWHAIRRRYQQVPVEAYVRSALGDRIPEPQALRPAATAVAPAQGRRVVDIPDEVQDEQ